MSERALRHDDRALAADRVDERLCDRGAHELVVGSKKREDVDLIERRDQRVHVDHRDAGLNHPDDRRGDRVDVHRLDGDEVPLLGRHLFDQPRCFAADSPGSNQVTSTLNSLPQNSAACFPCAHQVTCRPMFENAARSRRFGRRLWSPLEASTAPA